MSDPLHGYTLPLSPQGRSSFVAPPPWHFSGELLFVEFRVPEEAAARFLPPELEHGPDLGLAAAVFTDSQSCSDGGEEFLDPVRSQFKEFYVLLACRHRGRPAARCAFMWVDKPFSLVRGWIQGLPKKHGSLWMTKPVALGRAGPRLEPGGRFAATVATDDRRLAEATVELREVVDEPPVLHRTPVVNTRLFPAWGDATSELRETILSVSVQETGTVWRGDATLRFFDAPAEELSDLAPTEVLHGYRFAYANTLIAAAPAD